MKHIKVSMLMACFFLPQFLLAQNDEDAIRYSQNSFGSTARSLSMGGAFGALGADFSSISINPAGIAIYRRSEFTFTPAFQNRTVNSEYFGKSNSESKFNFNIGDIGLVWAFPKESKTSGWKGFVFGIGYNKINSFQTKSLFEGRNPDNSLLNKYVEDANGVAPDNLDAFGSQLGFQTYLIDTLPGFTNQYFSAIPNGGALQRGTSTSKGSLGEVVISFGGNYNDQLYMGGTIGVNSIRYDATTIFEETDDLKSIASQDLNHDFKYYKLENTLLTTGTGINFKFGLIYRPLDWLRIGGAIHTPSLYELNDEYKSTMTSQFENGESYSYDSPSGNFTYNLTTPLRAVGSVAFLYQNKGLLSVDYEFVDYTTASLDSREYPFTDENSVIQTRYESTANFRVGAEWKYEIFSFRAGTAIYGSPIDGGYDFTNGSQAAISYTGGIGMKEENFYLDLGYALTQSSNYYQPYSLHTASVPGAINKVNTHRVLLTFGFRF